MSARAVARNEFERQSVGICAMREEGGHRTLLVWPDDLVLRHVTGPDLAAEQPDAWLSIPEDIARAIYEALADHFGHTSNDNRALRRDYDAERARVDLLIRHAIGGAA